MKVRKGIKTILKEKASQGFENGMDKAKHSKPHVTIMMNSIMIFACVVGFVWLYMDGPNIIFVKIFLMIFTASALWVSIGHIKESIINIFKNGKEPDLEPK